jgi:hypothetical protein
MKEEVNHESSFIFSDGSPHGMLTDTRHETKKFPDRQSNLLTAGGTDQRSFVDLSQYHSFVNEACARLLVWQTPSAQASQAVFGDDGVDKQLTTVRVERKLNVDAVVHDSWRSQSVDFSGSSIPPQENVGSRVTAPAGFGSRSL